MPRAACPQCGAIGRIVSSVTLEAMLKPEAKARRGGGPYHFCKTPECPVVYYPEDGTAPFDTGDVRVTVFQKSTDPERLVCYCFEHRVSEIEAEVARTGTSKVPDEIAEKCRLGLEHCEDANPQGSCCLGNVRQVVRAAQARRAGGEAPAPAAPAEVEPESCCCGPAHCELPAPAE
ncbi:MAG: hypothetical protein D6729_19065 [Deltaproteobacteria bacterium]|nr:MAG: hypothetical protein D6729_19065 [Deltaproteobacteria bacterium]